jgi:hypothetical protein
MSNDSKADQRERLRSALRENLKRRKAQAKGRAGQSPQAGQGDDPASDNPEGRDPDRPHGKSG